MLRPSHFDVETSIVSKAINLSTLTDMEQLLRNVSLNANMISTTLNALIDIWSAFFFTVQQMCVGHCKQLCLLKKNDVIKFAKFSTERYKTAVGVMCRATGSLLKAETPQLK